MLVMESKSEKVMELLFGTFDFMTPSLLHFPTFILSQNRPGWDGLDGTVTLILQTESGKTTNLYILSQTRNLLFE
jgi:hypothetical protein